MSNESTSSNSQTDWQRLDAMSDEDIDLSDCPEITPELFAKASDREALPQGGGSHIENINTHQHRSPRLILK